VTGPITARVEVDWQELADLLTAPKPGTKDGAYWIAGDHPPGPRGNAHVRSISLLALDIEAKTERSPGTGIKTAVGPEPPAIHELAAEIELRGWRAALHTTYSHQDPSIHPAGIPHPRYRAALALDRPIRPEELDLLGRHVGSLLGISDCLDPSTLKPSQPLYLPRCPADRLALFESAVIEGRPLPTDALLRAARREQEALRAADGQRQPPQMGSIIQAFNARYRPGDVLLKHGYEPSGRTRWLFPGSTTGMAGVRVLPDSDPQRVYSSHTGDPLADGHAHDAFDCYRLLEHGGDLRAAVRAAAALLGVERAVTEVPAEWPSIEAANDGEPGERAEPLNRLQSALIRADTFGDALLRATRAPWLIEGWLPARSLAALVGKPKSGKSFVAVDLACSIAAGVAWQGHPTEQGTVLYVAAEGARGLLTRIEAWRQWHGVDPLPHLDVLPVSVCLDDPEQFVEVAPLLKQAIAEARRYRLIVVDTLARAMVGDENASKDMNQLVRSAERLQSSGAAVLLIHHLGKDAARGGRGSSVLPAAVDLEMTAESKPDENAGLAVRLAVTLTKDAAAPEPLSLATKPVTLQGITDAKGQAVATLVLEGRAGPAAVDLSGADTQALLGLFDDFEQRGERVVVATNSPGNAYRLFSDEETYPGLERGALFARLRAMQRAGLLGVEEVPTAGRRTREVWALTPWGRSALRGANPQEGRTREAA